MKNDQGFRWSALTFGAAYYPEQWDESLWEEDLRRMQAAGIQVVRVGDFSWSVFEPEEGVFSFRLFDIFMRTAEKTGMKVVFTTPTAAPPAWLTQKYPEVLNHTRTGIPFGHGGRRNYTYNSPRYRELCAIIVERIAQRYGPNPLIIGWQIDNELNCEASEFYSRADEEAFRVFLKRKYKTLNALNDAWGCVCWGQTYSRWEEVELPCITASEAGAGSSAVTGQTSGSSSSLNPHRLLDYYHFVDESCRAFCQMQSDILRRYIRTDAFITTNGTFPHLDNHKMTRNSLDFFSHDTYPGMAFKLDSGKKFPLMDRTWSMYLAQARAVSPHFGISEQQAGASGWNTCMLAPTPKPGQIRLWTMQSVAHGAEFICYFRWRTSCLGTEINWHGILDWDNRDNRRLTEVHETIAQCRLLQEIVGGESLAAVAVAEDYENRFDAEIDLLHGMLDDESRQAIFIASQVSHTPADYVWLTDESQPAELFRYRTVFYPHPCIITSKRVEILRCYVEAGGTLVLGAASGCKDIHGRHTMRPKPGELAELAGVDVIESTMADPAENRGIGWDDKTFPAPISHDILTPAEGTAVLGQFCGDFYCGSAALTEHPVGKGRVIYLGSAFSQQSVMAILKHLGLRSSWESVLSLPDECELMVRKKDDRLYFFVMNYSPKTQSIYLHEELRQLITGENCCGEYVMPPREAIVFRGNAEQGSNRMKYERRPK